MAPFPAPETGILLTHFVVSEDIARSRDFYANVLAASRAVVGWRYARGNQGRSACLSGGSAPGRILQPDFTAERDRGVNLRVGPE